MAIPNPNADEQPRETTMIVIPNLPAESGQERDLTKLLRWHKRRRD